MLTDVLVSQEMRMDFTLRVDAQSRALLVTLGETVNDATYMASLAAVKDFVTHQGLHHVITDFSSVQSFDMSNALLMQIGQMVIPVTVRRIVVATRPATYGSARLVQTYRSETAAPIEIVKTIAEACNLLGSAESEFVEV
jgi:hypothetical protein